MNGRGITDDALLAQISEFMARELGIKKERIDPDSTLFGDLGVDGADGWEFVECFGEEFNVDIADFRPELHFGPEAGATPISMLLCLVRWIRDRRAIPEQRVGLTPIRVMDLVGAAKGGRWPFSNKGS